MIRLFLLFSHDLTDKQYKEVKSRYNVDEIIKLPEELQKLWSNIPPEGEMDERLLDNVKIFMLDNAAEKNYALVQGEFGAVYIMVNWCFENDFIPIYSTTKRVYERQVQEDGTIINKHIFDHVNFRNYVK